MSFFTIHKKDPYKIFSILRLFTPKVYLSESAAPDLFKLCIMGGGGALWRPQPSLRSGFADKYLPPSAGKSIFLVEKNRFLAVLV
jgi:hypothetical protein